MFETSITYVSTKPSWEEMVPELAELAEVAAGVRELLVSLPVVLVAYARVSWGPNANLILLLGGARAHHLARALVEAAQR
jgi:hypothetical protein